MFGIWYCQFSRHLYFNMAFVILKSVAGYWALKKKKGLPCVIDLRRVIVLLRFFRAFSCFFLCKFVHRRVWLVFCMHLRLAGFKFLSRTRQFWRIVYHFGFRNIFIYVIFSRYNTCSRYMLNDFIFNRLQKWRRF